MCQCGQSGYRRGASYITVAIWTMAGAIWSKDGMRHAQSDAMVTVPRPTAAAMIWPMK